MKVVLARVKNLNHTIILVFLASMSRQLSFTLSANDDQHMVSEKMLVYPR